MLAPSTVSSLIRESDSILRGTVIRSELTSEYEGVATVKLKQAYVGWVPKQIFTIAWSRGEDGAPLAEVGQEYVFFLRHTETEVVEPTQAARSFWRLVEVAPDGPFVTPYVFPMTALQIDIPGLLGKAPIYVSGLPMDKNRVELQVMYLHVLVPAVKSLWRPRA